VEDQGLGKKQESRKYLLKSNSRDRVNIEEKKNANPKIYALDEEELNNINKLIDEEPMRILTQEEEEEIKGAISDINERAFYGKMMKN